MNELKNAIQTNGPETSPPKKLSKTSLPLGNVDPIYYTNVWAHPTHHPKQWLNRFNDYIV